MRSIILFVFVVVAAGCAPRSRGELAAKPAPVAAATPSKASDDLDKPICSFERTVGSNIPHRVCTTQRQLDEQRRAVEDLAHRAGR